MGFYDERILPRVLDLAMKNPEIAKTRSRVLAGLDGEVLEIGFGSGHNVAHYPREVVEIHAIEPSARSVALAQKRISASPSSVRQVGSDAQRIELPDGRFRNVVSTWTLCTIPDPARALHEIARVLAPGGVLRFVEHGRSPDADVYRRQQRLEPLWKRFTGGCHITREIDDLIADSGLEITSLRTYDHPKDPKIAAWTFEGTAVKR